MAGGVHLHVAVGAVHFGTLLCIGDRVVAAAASHGSLDALLDVVVDVRFGIFSQHTS